jgi:DDE superfamily endonuclease
VQTVRDAYPRDVVELWTTDQHRLGLKPILRRVWCRRGQRPTAVVQHRYQWCYLYAFVHPPSGRTFWLLLPTVSIMAFTVALAEFAQAVGAGRGKQILLVCDGAGWHVSPQVQLPAGVHLHLLPPYSPELQPAERLWPLTNESLANRHFQDLEALQTVQAQRCLALQAMPEVVRAHTNFHWWPQTG